MDSCSAIVEPPMTRAKHNRADKSWFDHFYIRNKSANFALSLRYNRPPVLPGAGTFDCDLNRPEI
jgi:hypothetical protein